MGSDLEPARVAEASPHEKHGVARRENERSGLRSYRGRRLELGDMLRAALYLAHSCGDADAENRARDLLARLARDRFRLAVTGQFSRGKSTLMNALLGEAYLPMGALPMTSVITTVRYGTRPRAVIRRHQAALPVEVPLAQIADYVAASSVRRAEMRVAAVEVEVPAEILRLGFEFIDTPGVGSSLTANTAVTRRFLPQADAVMLSCGDVPAEPLEPTGSAAGIDMGVVSFLTTSGGTHVPNPRHLAASTEQLAAAQRDLARKKRGSSRRRKAATKVARLHSKVARQRLDHAHKTALTLVRDHDLIVHEELTVKNMTARPKPRPDGNGGHEPNGAASKAGLNKSINDAG